MKKVFSFLLLTAALAFVSCGHKEEQATLYQCPMQCEGTKTYDKPGKCPVCGMDLKAVEVAPAAPDSSADHDSTRAV